MTFNIINYIYYAFLIILFFVIILLILYKQGKNIFSQLYTTIITDCGPEYEEYLGIENLMNMQLEIEYPTQMNLSKDFDIYTYKFCMKLISGYYIDYIEDPESTIKIPITLEHANQFIGYDLFKNVFSFTFNNNIIARLFVDINDNIWLILRGTDTLINGELEINLKIDSVEFITGIPIKNNDIPMVHLGYYTVYDQLIEPISDVIEQLQNINNFYIFGDSLGGSTSGILCYSLNKIVPVTQVYCNAAPMFCNESYSNLLKSENINLFRINNLSDDLARMPFIYNIPSIIHPKEKTIYY